jgi:polyphenol oxidase
VPAALEVMRGLGAREMVAAVGPCIGMDAFEVGPEVAAEFRRLSGPSRCEQLIRPGRADRLHLDLGAAIRRQLEDGGVREIELCGRCTVSEPEWFFSHRRDGLRSGRMAAVIGCRAG